MKNSVICALLLSSATYGVSTVPVGYFTLDVPAGSDGFAAVSVSQQNAYAGALSTATVDSDDGDGNGLDTGTITVATADAFTADEFNYDYFVRVTSSSTELNGMWFRITDTATNSVTVDLAGYPAAEGLSAGASFLTANDTFRIVPFWKLSDLFDGSVLENATTTTGPVNGDRVLFVSAADSNLIGGSSGEVNSSISVEVAYFQGPTPAAGFYEVDQTSGDLIETEIGYLAVAPDTYFIIRNNGTEPKSFVFSGFVPDTTLSTILERDADGVDNHVSNPFPIDINPYDLGLHTSPSFIKSTSILDPNGDILFVYNSGKTGTNRPADTSYHYYDGVSGQGSGAGWYITGTKTRVEEASTTYIIPAGSGFIIRTAPNSGANSVATTELPYSIN